MFATKRRIDLCIDIKFVIELYKHDIVVKGTHIGSHLGMFYIRISNTYNICTRNVKFVTLYEIFLDRKYIVRVLSNLVTAFCMINKYILY